MPTLHLSEALLAELKDACEREHPHEACGLLLGRLVPREGKGPKVEATRLHPARNAHRTPGSRFELAPEDFVAADAAARDEALEILAVYHSHPDGPDTPSAHDRGGAQQEWPSVIVALKDGRAASWRCWRRGGEPGPDGNPSMVEEKICVC